MDRDWPSGDVGVLLALIDEPGNVITPEGTVRLTDEQARGILELRLARLTGLERDKIQEEMTEVAAKIGELLAILSSRPRRMEVMRDELLKARAAIASPRMTDIIEADSDQDDESLIEPGQMVVTITRDGFIKRTPLETFRAQNRGGRGRSGASIRGDDIVTRSFHAHTHQWVLFFSSGGKAFRQRVWRLPEAGPTAKGRALVNLLPELGSDTITTVLPLPQDETLWDSLHLLFATASGGVRRNRLSDFRNVRATGLIAMKLDEGDRLIGVATCREGQDAFLATRKGRCIRFELSDDTVRVFAGRDSSGVRGIRIAAGDEVIGLSVLEHVAVTNEERAAYLRQANAKRRGNGNGEDETEPTGDEDQVAEVQLDEARIRQLEEAEEFLLTVTNAGFGKRSSAYEYRVTGRGGQGIANILLSPRNGTGVAASFPVRQGDDVMLMTDAGRLIRVPGDQVRITGRLAMGVTLFRVDADEHVTSVFPVIEAAGDENGTSEDPD
jgi:DNA gyrase subunit A